MLHKVYLILIVLICTISCKSSKKLVTKDGSSYERAVVVKSIAEEYQYVKRVCLDCQLLGQSLQYNEKKPYDVLRLQTSKGREVAYYFDISSFFGKGF